MLPPKPKTLSETMLHPGVILACLLAGGLTGHLWPQFALQLSFIGELYISLIKMLILPLMISAIVCSVSSLFSRPNASNALLRRIFLGYGLAMTLVAGITMAVALAVEPGAGLDSGAIKALAGLDGSNHGVRTELEMSLYAVEEVATSPLLNTLVEQVVPKNIFAALADNLTLQVLMFSILLGVAVGRLPADKGASLVAPFSSIFSSCLMLTRWFNILLPLSAFSIAANQIAASGTSTLKIALWLIVSMGAVTLGVILISLVTTSWRSRRSLVETFSAQRESFFMAAATSNSIACVPPMMEGLTRRLGFAWDEVELLVPLNIALLRLGSTVQHAMATLFIAQIYGRPLGLAEIAAVFVLSIVLGFASAGITSGRVVVAQTSVLCGYLGLPFEVMLVLFLALDPVVDMMRTLINVAGGSGAAAFICSAPKADQKLVTAESIPLRKV